MEDMAELVDRIYILADGQVVMSGTPREIFSQPEELYRLGLGIPQVTEVMHALRARGKNVRVDVLTVVEAEAEVCKLLNC